MRGPSFHCCFSLSSNPLLVATEATDGSGTIYGSFTNMVFHYWMFLVFPLLDLLFFVLNGSFTTSWYMDVSLCPSLPKTFREDRYESPIHHLLRKPVKQTNLSALKMKYRNHLGHSGIHHESSNFIHLRLRKLKKSSSKRIPSEIWLSQPAWKHLL